MGNRTLTVGSASKLLHLTGWRVGWVTGPRDLVTAVTIAHGYATFSSPTPFQHACALVINQANATDRNYHFGGAAQLFGDNWTLLATALLGTGIKVCRCSGGYFLVCDVAPLSDMEYCEQLASKCRIAALPMSLFYGDETAKKRCTLVRFSICKSRDTIERTCAAITQVKT